MTPNEAVAHNIKRAREMRGLNQRQAAEALNPFLTALGEKPWSSDVWHLAENAAKTGRAFSANETVALARLFQTEIRWLVQDSDIIGPQSELDEYSIEELQELVEKLLDQDRYRIWERDQEIEKRASIAEHLANLAQEIERGIGEGENDEQQSD